MAYHLAVGGALTLWSLAARAGGGAATDAYDGIRLGAPLDSHALLDVYLQGLTSPLGNRFARYRAFDDDGERPQLGFARLTLAHSPETFGFRLDVGAGDVADGFRDSDPEAHAHPFLARGFSYIEQAFVTAVVPVGPGVTIDVGKFGTPVGLEENESLTDWQYSRGLLFTLAEPTYHTGVRVTARFTDALAASLFSLNGWNTNLLGGNGMRTFSGALTWHPTPRWEAVVGYMAGPERAPTRLSTPTLNLRHEVDSYARYALSDRVALAATADYGHDASAGGVTYWGVGGYLRGELLSWLSAAVRGEHLSEPAGFATGTKQRLADLTLTVEGRFPVGPTTPRVRLEYRRDQSDERTFVSPTRGSSLHQDSVGAALVVALF